jgi:hypothetical protein
MEFSLLWHAPLCYWWSLDWKAVLMAEALSEWQEHCSWIHLRCYDLNMLTNVALFLHSIIWMHYLLQKPEGQLTHHIPVRLCKPLLHSGGGEVVVYPDFVHKVVRPPLGADKFQPLYESITLSRYLIHLKHFQALKERNGVAAGTCWKPTFTAWCFEGFGSCRSWHLAWPFGLAQNKATPTWFLHL